MAYKETGDPLIRMTQEQIAWQVNSVRETVGRMLKRFSQDGMLQISRNSVQLTNIGKLEKIANKKR